MFPEFNKTKIRSYMSLADFFYFFLVNIQSKNNCKVFSVLVTKLDGIHYFDSSYILRNLAMKRSHQKEVRKLKFTAILRFILMNYYILIISNKTKNKVTSHFVSMSFRTTLFIPCFMVFLYHQFLVILH